MSTSDAPPAANALDTHGPTAVAPSAAPAVRAPRSRKLARFMPWTSTAASSGLAMSLCVIWRTFLSGLGDEWLDRGEHGGHVGRLGECAVGGDALTEDGVQGRGVASLHGVDGQGGGEDLPALDVRGLAEVGGGAEILDRGRQLRDRGGAAERE